MTWTDRYDSALTHAFGAPTRLFVRGQGVHLWDDQGRRHLDLLAGIATVGLGHAHPALTAALADQAGRLGHISNFFASEPQIALAERLTGWLSGPARVFFTNSGTEANEAAFKLTRLTGRTKLVAAEGAFHGRTMGALALTWTEKYRAPFEPLPGQVEFVPYGDVEALARAVDDSTAAIVLEPIQGENGVVTPPPGYLAQARRLADRHGALLWLDEVQSGLGRTGDWLAQTAEGVQGDIVTLAKALGNGFPIGACLAAGPAADLFQPGQHGTTFGGNPLACRVSLTVLDLLEPLLPQVQATGRWLAQRLAEAPGVAELRGRGLLLGVRLEAPLAPALAAAALEAGYIVNAPRPDVIRLVPPLIIQPDDLVPFLDDWPGLWDQARLR
ncbi:MAG: acetylornithine transaminase [Propionibacteriaceae bacterium]|jgi:acetylornithine aminotransferase|nr:acetylornithine transaminase [Propionibacteriaceae bacterium]